MGTKKIGPQIDEELYNKFVEWVKHKYNGRTRGYIAIEIEYALRYHIYKEESRMLPRDETSTYTSGPETSTHTQKELDEEPTEEDKLVEAFKEEFGGKYKIKKTDLSRLIKRVTGLKDRRPVNDRIESMVIGGFIEETDKKSVFINKFQLSEITNEEIDNNLMIIRDHLKGRKINKPRDLPVEIRNSFTILPDYLQKEFLKGD